MSFRPPLRLVIVAMGILCLPPASTYSLLARAADEGTDPARATHESAVLNRIFANWKARHDRVRSLHFTWDSRLTLRQGSIDVTRQQKPGAASILSREQAFNEFGAQIWVNGDERVCTVHTPSFKAPAAAPTGAGRIVGRWMVDGKTQSLFYVKAPFETGAAKRHGYDRGHILRVPSKQPALLADLQPLFLTYRTQYTALSWQREQCHLITENAIVDGGHYVKFHRFVKDADPSREDICWIDPSRNDVVVHWEMRHESPGWGTWSGSIKYQKDRIYGWVPSGWTCEWSGPTRSTLECKVTKFEINEQAPPDTFTAKFPAGTAVLDEVNNRQFLIQNDGSKRLISREELDRLWNASDSSQE